MCKPRTASEPVIQPVFGQLFKVEFGGVHSRAAEARSKHRQTRIASFTINLLLLSALAVAPFFAVGCSDTSRDTDAALLRVDDVAYRLLPGGARIVSGTLHNPTDRPFSNAQIQVSLFDEDNKRIGNLSILVQDIEAQSSKPFREPVDVDLDVRSARVRSVIVL